MTSASFDTSAPAATAAAAPGTDRAPAPRGLDVAPVVEVADDGYRAVLDLPPQQRACAVARSTVAQLLRAWEVTDDERTHDVLLVVSELVGNAVRHGSVPLALDLALGSTALTVGVTDSGGGLPRQRAADGQEEGGRGLTIVDALAEQWGVEEHGDGKRVWARLPVDGTSVR